MIRRWSERGVTLIEILLALIVMVLGIVGILALFPTALQLSKESVEETQAGITAESVAQALTNAIRFAQWNSASGTYDVTLTHDLKYGGTYVKYQFPLPKLSDDWVHHPGLVPIAAGGAYDPESLPAFNLAGDPWVYSAVETVRNTNDMSDPYKMFGFSFAVMKINTMAHLIGTPKPGGGTYTEADLEPMVKLYEFRINVFRMITSVSGGGGTGGGGGATDTKKLLAFTTCRVSTK
jgi:type II secretory pathway pseudopilin PulG